MRKREKKINGVTIKDVVTDTDTLRNKHRHKKQRKTQLDRQTDKN